MARGKKEPLYRKDKKTAHLYRGDKGGDFRYQRHTKAMESFEGTRLPMNGKTRRGRDYTPLFRFLQSKVGQKWSEVHSEAVSRLDSSEPIEWIMAEGDEAIMCYFHTTFFHTLRVDEDGILQYVDKSKKMRPYCSCCTTTLDGIVVE